MISVKNINKTYSDGTKALIDINLEIPSTGLYFIMGKSGSGKTTLLNLLSALDMPSSGEIIVDGLTITDLNEKQSSLYRSSNIGFVFQQYNLIERWTVKRNISLALELAGKPVVENEIRDTCLLLGLIDDNGQPLINKKVANLSGGQKQRVAIARAIIKKPKILLCDEPTGALDKENSEYLLSALKKLSKNVCVIVVTHDSKLVDKDCNVIEMANGRIVSSSIKASNHVSGNENIMDKPKIGIANHFSLAFNFLTASKFRLSLSLLLLTICLFAFSLPVVCSNQSEFDVVATALIDNSEKYAVISNNTLQGDEYVFCPFNDTQKSLIEKYNDFENLYVYSSPFNDSKFYNSFSLYQHPYKYLLGTSFEKIIEIPNNFDLSLINTIRDPRLSTSLSCELPKNTYEIAITDLQADKLLKQGYVLSEDEPPLKFNSVDEILGAHIGEFLVTGIFKTSDSKDIFSDYDESQINDEVMSLAQGLFFSKMTFMTSGAIETIYKSAYSVEELKEHTTEYLPSASIIKVKSKNELKNLHAKMSKANESCAISLVGKYNHVIEKTSFLRSRFGKNILWTIVVATALFAFASTSLMFFMEFDIKKKELGIITTLGASKGYIVKILLTESLIMGSISLILSSAFLALFSAIINTKMMHTVLVLNTFAFLFIILFTLLLMGIVVLTIYLVNHKKKSIDLIKEL